MAYEPPIYPTTIPDPVTDLPDRLDDIDWLYAARYNELKKELVAALVELGTNPSGSMADVKTRLAVAIKDDGELKPFDSCRVYNSSDISIADNTVQYLTFDSEDFDTNGLHSVVSNTDRLTAQVAGKYLIVGNVTFAAHTVNRKGLILQKNGTSFLALRQFNSVQQINHVTVDVITTIAQLAATDYVRLGVFQNSGGALNVKFSLGYSPHFMMQLLSKD